MVRQLESIEGINEVQANKLRAAGIRGFSSLLARAATTRDRRKLAEETGISDKRILEWYNRADLQRIKGVGSEMADLLEAAGVDSIKELAQRRPDNLHAALLETNGRKKLVRRPPNAAQVQAWITEAKGWKHAE
jgi:predicted flap endonuclease-1-like 5' DNA nuclease